MDGFEIVDPRFRHYVLANASLETARHRISLDRGPGLDGRLELSAVQDLPRNRIMRWSEAEGVSVYREPSDYANGQTRDRAGPPDLVLASGPLPVPHRARRPRGDAGRPPRWPAAQFARTTWRSNRTGPIWFTDPLYGISNDYEGGRQQSEQPPALYRLDPASGDIRIAAADFDGPNGLAFSPDESRLYVAETGDQTTDDPQQFIRVFDVGVERQAVGRRSLSRRSSPAIATA